MNMNARNSIADNNASSNTEDMQQDMPQDAALATLTTEMLGLVSGGDGVICW